MPKRNEKVQVPIPIPEEARAQIRIGLRQAETLNVYLSGIRVALQVPEGWQLDTERLNFKPPDKEKKV